MLKSSHRVKCRMGGFLMKHGDFTKLAKEYVNRPGYSRNVLKMIGRSIGMDRRDFYVADVGAGTGKLTEELAGLGMVGCAVEPNDAMREEGIKTFEGKSNFIWSKGTAEHTNLPENNFDWVLMGSSFHWANTEEALIEFHRILKPGGYFTAIYNPRDIEGHELHERIEQVIYDSVPNMKRVSSGGKKNIGDIEGKLLSTKYFGNIIFTESPHSVTMSKERYMGVWRSVNDIRVQAGEDMFQKILDKIAEIIEPYEEIVVPYRSRAWTVQAL